MKIKAYALFIRGNSDVPILNMISTNEDSLRRYANSVLGSGVGFKIEQCEVSGFTAQWEKNLSGGRG
jgi:hypothetical protein